MSDPWENRGMIAKQKRLPLIGLAAIEPVEILKPHSAGPLVERSGQAVLIRWSIMVLAEPACGVAIVTQDSANGRFVPSNDAVVARIAGSHLGDHAKPHRVVVAATGSGCACGRAEGGWMQLSSTQSRSW